MSVNLVQTTLIRVNEVIGFIPVPLVSDILRNVVAGVAHKTLFFPKEIETETEANVETEIEAETAAAVEPLDEREEHGESQTSLPSLATINSQSTGALRLRNLSGVVCHLPPGDKKILINNNVFRQMLSYGELETEDFEEIREELKISDELKVEESAVLYNCPVTNKPTCVTFDGMYTVDGVSVRSYRRLCPEDDESLSNTDIYKRKLIEEIAVYANGLLMRHIVKKIPLKFHPNVLLARLCIFLAEKSNCPKLIRLLQRIGEIVISTLAKIGVLAVIFLIRPVLALVVSIAIGIICGVVVLFVKTITDQNNEGKTTFIENCSLSINEGKAHHVFKHIKDATPIEGYIFALISAIAVPLLFTSGLSLATLFGAGCYAVIDTPYRIYQKGKEAISEFRG